MVSRSTCVVLVIAFAGCAPKLVSTDSGTDDTGPGSTETGGTSDVTGSETTATETSDVTGSETTTTGTSDVTGTVTSTELEDCGGVTCDEDEYCDWWGNSCGGECIEESDLADCLARPTDCDDVLQPVCGCDGKVYSNACEAKAAGVDLQDEDPLCRSTAPDPATPRASCETPEGYFRCAFLYCEISTSYCQETELDYFPTDRDVTCEPLPESCKDAPSCDCLTDMGCIYGEICTEVPGGGLWYQCGEWGRRRASR